MNKPVILFVGIGLVFFIFLVKIPSPTGKVIEETGNYAELLNHHVTDFFQIGGVMFPLDNCGAVAKQIYEDIAFVIVDTTTGFSTSGVERLASLNFVIDRTERYGTIDMAKGRTLVGKNGVDSMIALNVEAIVRVPKNSRSNFVAMELYGNSDGIFTVEHGAFSTASLDCTFVVSNGRTVCDCKTHPIQDISVAGITAPRRITVTGNSLVSTR